ncbi:putative toxin-antitoxin system toxin component, PIN family [Amphibiibacter pelophylacis]|uniref:Toxin-antitoxin system toxin component, PIN family n=1 Tax=Amphibiibacter pelophylacis TaxID=1799477 RepID=A0ACC6P236_9BURK
MTDPDLQPVAVHRLVVDTNVLLDWLVFGHPDSARWLDAVRAGRLLWCVSPAVLAEYAHMTDPARWADRSSDTGETLDSLSALIQPHPDPSPPLIRPRCSDRDDQMFVDLALALAPALLLTRDRALLKLRRKLAGLGVTVAEPQISPVPAPEGAPWSGPGTAPTDSHTPPCGPLP